MKKLLAVFLILPFIASPVLMAQRAQRGGGRGGGRGAAAPEATGDMLALANQIAAAINAQDAEALQGLLAPDAVYLDEDGHALPPGVWATRITTGEPAKQIEISGTHSQEWNDSGWVSFNYAFSENFQGQAITARGTASIVARRIDGDWRIVLVHGALEQHIAGFTN